MKAKRCYVCYRRLAAERYSRGFKRCDDCVVAREAARTERRRKARRSDDRIPLFTPEEMARWNRNLQALRERYGVWTEYGRHYGRAYSRGVGYSN